MEPLLSFLGFSSAEHSSTEEKSDIFVADELIPPQILTEILLRVNDAHTIAYVCPLVCKRWYSVLSAPGFWISYMRYRSLSLPPSTIRSLSSFNIKKVCIKQPFGRNLITNPSGEHGFRGWKITDNGGDRFKIERPPINCADSLPEVNIQVAFVTSFSWCKKNQLIDLWEAGIEPAFLNEFCPPITVSEYYNCRFDCASVYRLEVKLLSDQYRIEQINRRPPHVHLRRGYPHLIHPRDLHPDMNTEETTNTSVIRIRRMLQWTEAEWQKIEHTFVNYPRGIRYVFYEHGGMDEQFWAGHYGAKMAKASIVVNYGNGERRSIDKSSSSES